MVSLMAHPSAAKRARGAADPLAGGTNRQLDRDAFSSGLRLHPAIMACRALKLNLNKV
jgi:hypothetical protein